MSGALTSNSMGRLRYRGLREPVRNRIEVFWGEIGRLHAPAGSVVSITNVDGAASCCISALSDDERTVSTAAIDLPEGVAHRLDPATFDSRMMAARVASRGGSLEAGKAYRLFDETARPGEVFVTRMRCAAELFLFVESCDGYVESGGGGRFAVEVKPVQNAAFGEFLPEPPGKVVNEIRIDRCTAQAYELAKGQFVQIIDVQGQQCSDFMAMRSDSLEAGIERHIDSTVSRTMTRSAYPLPGLNDKFFDQDIRPLLSVRQDTVGRHDAFALACTARGYEDRGFPGHVNCSDNISAVFQPYGIQPRRAWPAINFFFNSWINWNEHGMSSDEAWSRPGDFVLLEALTDLVCVSTACPDDIDPINGWNPTDIHLRICEEDTSITHSVAWRSQPEDASRMTQHTPFSPRTSLRTSSFHAARDTWMPSQYDATGVIEEHWACRNAATLQDMSGLRKFDIVGPDAEELLQKCLTRDISRLSVHRGIYALICDERGSVLDDGTLFRLETTAFRWCCSSDDCALHLREQAEQAGLDARILSLGQRLPNLAIQGPASRDILREVVFTHPARPSLDNLKWFGFTIGRLHDRDGPAFMLSRTGFTGELGYEIFCDERDALGIWDGLIQAGDKHGLVPMGGEALSVLRIEAGLMSAGAEFGPDSDAFESGLGFAVDFGKGDFIGRAALERNATAPRRKLVGLVFAGNEVPIQGDGVFVGREQVGLVTSACRSPVIGRAIAMARLAVENAAIGNSLEVGKLGGHMKRLACTVSELPFVDPERKRPRS